MNSDALPKAWVAASKAPTLYSSSQKLTFPSNAARTSPTASLYAQSILKQKEPNHTHFTVGGDRINYPGKVATPTADMLTAKILFNGIISTPSTRFMTLDICNFYLMTPLKCPEYLHMKLRDIQEERRDHPRFKP
jgi:hypothetical protein